MAVQGSLNHHSPSLVKPNYNPVPETVTLNVGDVIHEISASKSTELEKTIIKTYNAVTTNFWWRAFIGRGTSAIKFAIYSVGFCALSVKTICKVVAAPFVSLAVFAGGGKQLEWSWTLDGVGKDAVFALKLADQGVGSLIGFATSPHIKSHSIFDALMHVANALNGEHHYRTLRKLGKDKNEAGSFLESYIPRNDVTASHYFRIWQIKRPEWSELVTGKNPLPLSKKKVEDMKKFVSQNVKRLLRYNDKEIENRILQKGFKQAKGG